MTAVRTRSDGVAGTTATAAIFQLRDTGRLMALHEAHREDLFGEATALRRRIEISVPGEAEPVVAGCRENGAWSIYFGPDPCYHFDAAGLLRRGFIGDALYRTQGHTLARLTRNRTDDSVELRRTDLSTAECRDLIERMRQRLESLDRAIRDGTARCLRRHPEDDSLPMELSAAIQRILAAGPGLAPAIATRRD